MYMQVYMSLVFVIISIRVISLITIYWNDGILNSYIYRIFLATPAINTNYYSMTIY